MKLRGRFTLWFSLAALIPIATAALVTRTIVSDTYRTQAKRLHEEAEETTGQVIEEARADLVRLIRELAKAEDPYVGGALLALERDSGDLTPEAHQRIREMGGRLMHQLSLDALYLLDHRGVVLDAPHYVPAVGEKNPELVARGRRKETAPYYAMDAVWENGTIHKRLVLQAATRLRGDGYTVTVVGGRQVDEEFIASIRELDSVDARVVTATGAVLVKALRPWDETGNIVSYGLNDDRGKMVAVVEVQVTNDTLPQLLRKVTLFSGLVAVVALAITTLLGYWVARRMTRDLDSLVKGAQAVARGELDTPLDIPRSDEIREVGDAFNTMMLDLKESKERLIMAERVAAWQEIARRLAHEIKNPLTPIQMSMETLRKTWTKKHPSFDEIFEESTATVLEEAARLKRIVSEFSDFARMPSPDKHPLCLADVVHAQLALYQGVVPIVEQFDSTIALVNADRDSLSQVILNLVENARDALADHQTPEIVVSIEAVRDGRFVALVVDDNGPGISSANKDKLFTPYFTTKHAHGGTGLGLALVHRIVTDHGGTIWAGESPKGGARFVVEFPGVRLCPKTS